MPSKYGGIPVDEAPSGGSKYGGVPVAATPATPGMEKLGGTPPPAAAPPLPQALRARGGFPQGPIPEGTPVMGAPIMPPTLAPMGLASAGLSKLDQASGIAHLTSHGVPVQGGPVVPKPGTEPMVAKSINSLIPSRARAGENFNQIEQAIGNEPVNMAQPAQTAFEAKRMESFGHPPSTAVNKFLKQVEVPPAGPLTGRNPVLGPSNIQEIPYRDSRQFASSVGNPSVTDKLATDPAMQSKLGQLARALDTANEGAAERAGLGDQYRAAMKEYRQASQMKKGLLTAAKVGAGAVGSGVAFDLARKYMFSK